MTVAPSNRAYVPPRYLGPSTWIYALGMTAVFVAIPPYPSTGGSWTLRIIIAILFGIGAGLVNVWSDRRQERKLLGELAAERASARPLPKQRG